MFTATSDDQGHFTLSEVPPGLYRREIITKCEKDRLGMDYVAVEVFPGQTTSIKIGGTGCAVAGRFVAPQGVEVAEWTNPMATAILAAEPQASPPVGLDKEALQRWEIDYWASLAGLESRRTARAYSVHLNPDGTFLINGVRP